MAIRPIFLRPIEITASNKDFKYGTNAGGAVAKAIPTGTYAHIGTLLDAIEDLMKGEIADTDITFNSSKFKFTITAGTAFDFEASDTDLFALLGFTTDVSNATTTTAQYTPSHLWFPTYSFGSQDFFELDHGDSVQGVTAYDGRFHGVAFGDERRTMSFEFPGEPAANVAREFCVNASQVNGAGTTYYWDEARCFETFAYGSRTARAATATSAPLGGFFYYPDFTDVAVAESEDVGGVRFNLGSGADDHVFCHIVGNIGSPRPFVPNGRAYYTVSFNARTAEMPTGML